MNLQIQKYYLSLYHRSWLVVCQQLPSYNQVQLFNSKLTVQVRTFLCLLVQQVKLGLHLFLDSNIQLGKVYIHHLLEENSNHLHKLQVLRMMYPMMM